MEIENKSTHDCSCDDNCCQPSKNKLWKKIVFIVIIVGALAVVAIKLTSNSSKAEPQKAAVKTEKPACCDTTKMNSCIKICDPKKDSKCCP